MFGSGINVETIIAICAVIISTLSMAFTIIFSLLQVQHNRNSVKPICYIRIGDYEDCLFVEIDNVGTGPLTIKKFNAIKGTDIKHDLISLMPSDLNQYWSTFTTNIEGMTIPINGKIKIIEISPSNNQNRTKVRNALKDITIYVEYSDIYNRKFTDEKALGFFGRHDIDQE